MLSSPSSDNPTTLLRAARLSAEAHEYAALEADSELARLLSMARSRRFAFNPRQKLLSHAVRIDVNMLPELAAALEEVRQRGGLTVPLEGYVSANPDINAAVIGAKDRILVVLSSGAVERLNRQELDFVIGHELGHSAFGHVDLPVMAVLEMASDELKPRQAMRLLAWHRLAELSADRAGLVCCGSIEVAAQTMFKTLSGLSLPGLKIDPDEFAGQWDALAEELRSNAVHDAWMAPHPMPPLRVRALLAFWRSDVATQLMPEAEGGMPIDQAEAVIQRGLDLMNPLARERAASTKQQDPLLTGFVLWAALHVASAHRATTQRRISRIRDYIGHEVVKQALGGMQDTSMSFFREQFLEARTRRQKPLTAIEFQRIFSSLAEIFKTDGEVHPDEIAAMKEIAADCRISAKAIDRLL